MNQFNHIYPPVPKHSSFTIKVKEEKAKTTNILDESAKKPSRSWIFSLVSHSILLLGMVLIGLDSPQITKAIVIEMSSISKEEELSFDEIAGVTLDDLAEMDIDVGEMMVRSRTEEVLDSSQKLKARHLLLTPSLCS